MTTNTTTKWLQSQQRKRTAATVLLLIACVAVPLSGSLHTIALYVATLTTLLAAAALRVWARVERLLLAEELPGMTLAVAGDAEAFGLFQSLGNSLRRMSSNHDPIYRELALTRLRRVREEASEVAEGRIEFVGTEAWRQAYEELLRSRSLYRYRSVAYARTPTYWQDEPGRQSMRVNFEVAAGGLPIERVVIVPDAFWPSGEFEPVDPLGKWLDAQARAGVAVSVVRESLLEGELDLLADFGLYGNRAVGFQQLDDHGRIVRFLLSFELGELFAAVRLWERL